MHFHFKKLYFLKCNTLISRPYISKVILRNEKICKYKKLWSSWQIGKVTIETGKLKTKTADQLRSFEGADFSWALSEGFTFLIVSASFNNLF